ncbi:hypothetical protein DSO57_1029443 [Entomophthora muscae]|uniref:Uncharacterized protein n=1 Tax=Entomophthora muscae TaxID=34485 RepID=A0ACC2RS97_9FUNG|nr:hypothetical protein DSO57_1029443 [Entomophthora muscae]
MLGEAVQRAQMAALNPTRKPKWFLDAPLDSLNSFSNELVYSTNTVVVKIKGSAQTLTLVELPGFAFENKVFFLSNSVDYFKALVATYLANPQVYILTVTSFQNEAESKYIQESLDNYDPLRKRTFEILTKPDTIAPGMQETWFQRFKVQKAKLKLGSFIVNLPENDATFEDRIDQEKAYFHGEFPWNKVDGTLKNYLGVKNFLRALKAEFASDINTLRILRCKVTELIRAAEKELLALPKPLNQNPKLEFVSRIHSFIDFLKETLRARSSNMYFYQKIQLRFDAFIMGITQSHPRLILSDKHFVRSLKSTCKHVVYSSQDSLEYGFSIEHIEKILERQKGQDLACFVKGGVLNESIRKCQSGWLAQALKCLCDVEKEIRYALPGFLDQFFGNFQSLPMYIESKLDGLLYTLKQSVTERITEIHDMEIDSPATWDKENLDAIVGSYHDSIEDSIKPLRKHIKLVPPPN